MSVNMQRIPMVLLLFIALLAQPAIARAHTPSNPAWSLASISLQSGPGTRYAPAKSSVVKGQEISVTRCTNRWCTLAGFDGWLSMDNISFGQAANPPYSGPKFTKGSGVEGTVCLYTGENFTGEALCLPSGAVAPDLALYGIDNSFASVSIEGDVSVSLCRDRNFSSLCQRFDESTPRLDRLLLREVSSYRVY